MTEALAPGGAIGILGGGQLGRMLGMAAARLGFATTVFDPDPLAPAAQVCSAHIRAAYDDADALRRFAASVDIATYEFENIPAEALDIIEDAVPVRPGRNALTISQDRLTEKSWLAELGVPVAPFAPASTPGELEEALRRIGTPAILKTRRFGYDGKGQIRIGAPEDSAAALEALEGAQAILEGVVPFEREISVIGARGLGGAVVCYDPGENVHAEGILRTTAVPAAIAGGLAEDAVLIAGRILSALDYVGVLGVELFVSPTGLLVNEFAPRVHNSGHWTEAACLIDQFEQHVRAIAGWPLGDGVRHSDAVMTNLIGDEASGWEKQAAAALHLYGKAESRPGRKMGHVTRITPRTR